MPAVAGPATPGPVPSISSPAVVSQQPVSQKGDFDAPVTPTTASTGVSAPLVFDKASAAVTAQDEYSTTYTDKNGVNQTEVSASPVNIKSGGAWVPVMTALVDDGQGGLKTPTNPLSPKLRGTASDAALFSVSREGYIVSFSLKGATSARVEHSVVPFLNIGAEQAHYSNVFPDTDLHYEVGTEGVKESIVLKSAPSKKSAVVYTWLISAPGLTLAKTAFGDLEFSSASGEVIFTMPMPVMWDSSGVEGESGSAITSVAYDVTQKSRSGYELVLRPNTEWLQSPDRVYPVIIDPTTSPGATDIRSYKEGVAGTGQYHTGSVWIGDNRQSTTCCNWRTTAFYNYGAAASQRVIGATLYSTYVANSGTANCYAGGIYAANALTYSGAGSYLSAFPNCGGSNGGAGDARIWQQYSAWVNAGQTGGYLMLTGAEDCNCYAFKQLTTSLTLTYVAKPTITGVTSSTPQNGQRGPVMPIMQATGTDATSSGLNFQYAFTSSDGGTAFTSPWTPSGPYQVPQGKLTAGKQYT